MGKSSPCLRASQTCHITCIRLTIEDYHIILWALHRRILTKFPTMIQILPLIIKHKVLDLNKAYAHLANDSLPLEV